MSHRRNARIEWIPIDHITVVNPRERGKSKFKQILSNIANLGLKKPITVTPREGKNGDTRYDLVCGQGRLQVCKELGHTEVPAVVVEVSREELLLMSLAENLARRRHRALDLAKEITAMKERGYSEKDIAQKTDLPETYVRGIIRLLNKGETRLLQAVEQGQIPITIAMTIASSDDAAVQRALAEAYESKSLRGKALLKARRLVELRRSRGKNGRGGGGGQNGDDLSSRQVLRTYQQEMNRQRLLVTKAKVCETRLLFIVSALKSLLRDENFVNLLRAESLDVPSQFLAEQVYGKVAPK